MTTIQILNEKIKSILGLRYEANFTNELQIRFSGYRVSTSQMLRDIENKAGFESKKEIAKLCLMVSFGK